MNDDWVVYQTGQDEGPPEFEFGRGVEQSALDKQVGGNHYKDMKIQPIEYITGNKMDWYQGNIIKYATRHHFKNGAEDLKKVIHYAELALEAQYGQTPSQRT